jgi:hypothetical protein
MSRKVSDEFTVPLCRVHHTELHKVGREAVQWHDMEIDPPEILLECGGQPSGLILWRSFTNHGEGGLG